MRRIYSFVVFFFFVGVVWFVALPFVSFSSSFFIVLCHFIRFELVFPPALISHSIIVFFFVLLSFLIVYYHFLFSYFVCSYHFFCSLASFSIFILLLLSFCISSDYVCDSNWIYLFLFWLCFFFLFRDFLPFFSRISFHFIFCRSGWFWFCIFLYNRWHWIIAGSSKQNRFEETRLTLRIHRGRRSNSVPRISPPLTGHHLKPSKSIGTTSLERRRECMAKSRTDEIKTECTANDIAITSKSPILHMMQITLNRKENMESFLCNNKMANETNQTDVKSGDGSKTIKGVGRRIFKVQAKRFRMETKAAKTLALIVGGFILCWLPFFTMYMIRAFCQLCIEPLLFSILFWLGYCNSAINPLIYALFSKDFRIAFKTILYKCLCFHCCKRDASTNDCANNKGLYQHSIGGDTSSRWHRSMNSLRVAGKHGTQHRRKTSITKLKTTSITNPMICLESIGPESIDNTHHPTISTITDSTP